MYKLLKYLGIVLAGIILLIATPAVSQDAQDNEFEISKIVAHFAEQLEASLEDVNKEDSGLPELQEYLYNAMAMVFYARADVCREIGPEIAIVNLDLNKLVELGYLPYWPGDPLANMEPIKVVTPEDGFTPNAICFALCPPSYASYIKGRDQVRISYDLFVYGPDKLLSGFGQVIQPEGNKEWSEVPEGAMYGLGFYVDPVSVVDARIAKQAKKDEGPPANSP